MIKIQERILWSLVVGLSAFHILNKIDQTNNLETIITTYDMESNIQEAQINDFNMQLDAAREASYSKGFEEGRTQAGVVLAEGGSLYDYKDGYHAAMDQVTEEAHLDVAKGLMTELQNLRKMVPRLLNQVEQITKEKEALKAESEILSMLMDDLDEEESADEIYLEIIEFLATVKEEGEEE